MKIHAARVFVAGCGGLGSNVAYLLVRCGFQKLTLLDCDMVEESNLNRQLYFPEQLGQPKAEALAHTLLLLEPGLQLHTLVRRLQGTEVPGLTADSDFLVEAFDEPAGKAAFTAAAAATGKPTVCASGIAGYGNTDALMVHRVGKHIFAVGDGSSGVDDRPPLAPRVMVAAAKQADVILQLTLEGDTVFECE